MVAKKRKSGESEYKRVELEEGRKVGICDVTVSTVIAAVTHFQFCCPCPLLSSLAVLSFLGPRHSTFTVNPL